MNFIFSSPSAIFAIFLCIIWCCITLLVQEMQRETPSYEALLQGLENLGVCLFPTAPEVRVHELREELRQIRGRSTSMKNSISHRQLTFYLL